MIKNQLKALEKAVAKNASHDDYIQALERVVAHMRAYADYLLHDSEGEAPADTHLGDIDLIMAYEAKLKNRRDMRLPDGLDAKVRPIFESLPDDVLRKMIGEQKPVNNPWVQTYD